MKNLFVLFIILCTLTGCFTVSRPAPGTVTYSHLAASEVPQEPSDDEEEVEPEAERQSGIHGMSDPVIVLLGLGAIIMITSLGAVMYDDNTSEGGQYFAAGSLGLGLTLWGAAGIVALSE